MTKKELLKKMQRLSIEPRYHFMTRELIGVAVDYIPTLRYKSRMIEIEIFVAKHKYDMFSLQFMTKKKRNKKRSVKKSFKDGFITLTKEQVEASRSKAYKYVL